MGQHQRLTCKFCGYSREIFVSNAARDALRVIESNSWHVVFTSQIKNGPHEEIYDQDRHLCFHLYCPECGEIYFKTPHSGAPGYWDIGKTSSNQADWEQLKAFVAKEAIECVM